MSATTADAPAAAPQRMEFKTELKQLLDLIIHSLYTKKEIFLRELISNAADAIDKLRFEGLKTPELLEGDPDFKIRLIPDEAAQTLTISDNGVGMGQASIVENLGTIAKSGTRAFLDGLKAADAQQRPELIGQFGVGFYASFMVADRVTVLSRPAGAENAGDGVRWVSDGQGDFTVEPYDKPTRGTDVILHLRDDAKEFLESYRLEHIVKQYSDFIEHPVESVITETPEAEEGKEEKPEPTTTTRVLNSRQAIWLRNRSEVKPEEYTAFYKQLSHDQEDPAKTIHIAAEGGAVEFRALLFVPAKRPFDMLGGPEKKSGIDLYVRRVLIQHECEELNPPYLRFVRGVVDCLDLPLNVSREVLQHHPRLAKIKSNLVNRVIKTLGDMKNAEYDKYLSFYKDFGPYLKEGAAQDWENREALADLLLFESTKTEPGKFTTLAKYVETMPAEQKDIYYLVGEGREVVEHSPHLESFKAGGQEVLLLTEPIDEFFVSSFYNYKGKTLKAADREVAPTDESDERKAQAEQFKPLLEALKAKLADDVKEVRLSARLKESAAVLVADAGAMSAHMERLMERLGRGEQVTPSKRILELNADHPAVQALQKLQERDAGDARIESYAKILFDQAVLAEGSRVKDPAAFARRVNELLAKGAA